MDFRRHALAIAVLLAACRPSLDGIDERGRRSAPEHTLRISVEQQATWVRNFNPFMTGKYRWPTVGPIHEAMFVYSSARATFEPWLATGHTWSDDRRSLRIQLREGVTWSDGAPFTPYDVVFTFQLLRAHPALDGGGLWKFLTDVHTAGAAEVEVVFARPFVPGFAGVAQLPIVPAHVWSKVADPTTFANPTPVGTGPYTEVTVFRNQVFELGRNPRYWQPGRFAVERLRFPALSSNEQAMLALLRGELDWAGNFVPDAERIYVARDPAHHGFWYPATGASVLLYANTRRAPFHDVRVRKAMSLAIDRARLARVAMYGYTRAADATGLSDAYASWRSAEVVAAGDWVAHDPARAEALLDAAGYPRGADGIRRGAHGAPLVYALHVVSGWSDWVRACQLVADDLRAVGIDVRVKPYDFGAWFDRLQTGDFDLSIGWSSDGATPYLFYRDLMASQTVKPLGDKAGVNWHRFASARADRLLAAFETTAEPEAQHTLMAQIQAVFSDEAPAIPLFPGPAWGVYSSARFRGFPTAASPFAVLSPNPHASYQAEYMLVLAALTPSRGRGR